MRLDQQKNNKTPTAKNNNVILRVSWNNSQQTKYKTLTAIKKAKK